MSDSVSDIVDSEVPEYLRLLDELSTKVCFRVPVI